MLSAFFQTAGSIELREVPKPEPGPGETLVKVRRCGICGSDLHVFHGGFPPPAVCIGHEISGEVAEVGAGVTTVKAGDRVAIEPLVVCGHCEFCRIGDYQLCRQMQILGVVRDGGFSEYVQVPASCLFALPAAVDFEVGALTEPLAVAVHGVRLANVRLGDRVLVQGAGSIGLMAVAAARAAGAGDVWVTARHPQQAEAATILGATRVFRGAEAAGELSNAAMSEPIDAVIETVGGTADTLTEAMQVVRPAGIISVLGIFTKLPRLNTMLLVLREVRLVGSMTYGRSGARADFDVALQLLASMPERFRRMVTHRVPLAQIQQGFETAADKQTGAIKVAVDCG